MNEYGSKTPSRAAPGSYLQRLYTDLSKMLTDYRLKLIESLEQDMPYRSVKLSPIEQYTKFQKMDGNSYAQLISRLYERYRGLPNATERVNADLVRYLRQMMTLGETIQTEVDPMYQQMFDPRQMGGSLDAP